MTTATLRQVGDAVALPLPESVLEALGLQAGSRVTVTLEGDRVVLSPARERLSLEQLLAEQEALERELTGTLRERVLASLRAHEATIRRHGIERLWLFGSVARGEANPHSDVDVLVRLEPGRSFSAFDLSALRLDLVDMLDHDVGVLVEEDLPPQLAARIRDDLVRVF